MAKAKMKIKTKTKTKIKARPKPKAKVKAKVKKVIRKVAAKKPASKAKAVPKKAAVTKAKVKTLPKISLKSLDKIGLNPLSDRLIVKVAEGEKRTAGGLYIPDTARLSGNHKGQVLATGRGSTNKKGQLRPMDVKMGDQILFSEYAGEKMNIDGHEVLILRESDVLGIVEK